MKKPTAKILERAKKQLQENFDASSAFVKQKSTDWEKYRKLYLSQQDDREHDWESNLIMPKGDQIIETIAPRIMAAIFSVADWITIKNPDIEQTDLLKLQKEFAHILDRKSNFYLTAVELFKEAANIGTSFCKIYPKGLYPFTEFVTAENFGPDPSCNKPGRIDDMRYCYHLFQKSISQLSRLKAPSVIDNPEKAGYLYAGMENVYFDLDKLIKKKTLQKDAFITKESDGSEANADATGTPVYDLIEQWGEFEVKNRVWEEYVITAVLNGDKIETIIRCEPSTNYFETEEEGEKNYYKPFIASIYQIVPGSFYGKGALQAVESLIVEQKEHHDLFLDQHKRSLTNIVQVLERSDLTEDDLIRKPDSLWFLKNHDDVKIVDTPEVNFGAFGNMHSILDREIEKTSRATAETVGIGQSKRETLGEFTGLMAAAEKVFTLFIQQADRLTLRPLAEKTFNILKRGKEDGFFKNIEFNFAATAVETEYSKYSKQQQFPNLLREIANILQNDPTYQFDLPNVLKMMDNLYDFKETSDFVKKREAMIPVAALPEEIQPIAVEIMREISKQQNEGEAS